MGDRYAGKQAVLFGLENIAEEGWTQANTLNAFVAHFSQREQAQLADGSALWWQLYTEGVAQWSEHLMFGRPTWHMQNEEQKDWLGWCQENRASLAAEFLRCLNEGESTRPFFGSWYDLQGYKQTGCFLRHELIKGVAAEKSLREITLLEDFTSPLRHFLEEMTLN